MDISFGAPASPAWFAHLPSVVSATADQGAQSIHLVVQGELREVIQAAAAHEATNIATYEPSLEEIFLRFYTLPQTPTLPPLQIHASADAWSVGDGATPRA
jgi:ABC-2 type transport system ATP-binding protein